ncbi:MAG: dihydropyrimidinase [Anaerolineaceae bacterium]|nr:dihydropyrimidinase [Anaerolineaceae bacterium]
MAIIIKSGTIITASETFQADILIDGEKISQIGEDIQIPGAEIISAEGCYIMPGGVDPHVHLELPMFDTISSDDFYSGHKAAAFGGTTCAIDFIPQLGMVLEESIDQWHAKARDKAVIDYGFHMNITHFSSEILEAIPRLVEKGIPSIKVFTAYEHMRLKDAEIFQVLRIARNHGVLPMIHAENGDVIDILVNEAVRDGNLSPIWHAKCRPKWGAIEATMRGIALSQMAESPLYIVHMNAGGEVDQLAYAREKGLPIMGETCPQYLFFTEEDIDKPDGAKFICSPPPRDREDNIRIWEGLSDDVIQVVGTDHCAFFLEGNKPIVYEGKEIAIAGKELGADDFRKIPNGLPGIGDRLPILWSYGVKAGKITPNQFVALTATNPAKIFGMYPQKGTLMPGADADIVIWDPEKEIDFGVKISHHRTDYNLYEGWQVQGYPIKVFSRGRLIVDGENWLGAPGTGRFIKRKPFTTVI